MLTNFSSSIFFLNSFQSGSGFGISWELLPSYQWPLGYLIQWLVLSTVTWPIIAFTMVNYFSILKHFLHLHIICLNFQDIWCSVLLPQWLLLLNLLCCFYLSDFQMMENSLWTSSFFYAHFLGDLSFMASNVNYYIDYKFLSLTQLSILNSRFAYLAVYLTSPLALVFKLNLSKTELLLFPNLTCPYHSLQKIGSQSKLSTTLSLSLPIKMGINMRNYGHIT